jgi:hypothetical protein
MQMNRRSVAAVASLVSVFASGVFARQQTTRDARNQPTVSVGTAELSGTVVEDGPEGRPDQACDRDDCIDSRLWPDAATSHRHR